MHEALLKLPGEVEILTDGKLIDDICTLYKIYSVDNGCKIHHVLYVLENEQLAEQYLQEKHARITEHALMFKNSEKQWFIQPQMPLASNSAAASEMLSRMKSALVVWRKDKYIYKVFCSKIAEDSSDLSKETTQHFVIDKCQAIIDENQV